MIAVVVLGNGMLANRATKAVRRMWVLRAAPGGVPRGDSGSSPMAKAIAIAMAGE